MVAVERPLSTNMLQMVAKHFPGCTGTGNEYVMPCMMAQHQMFHVSQSCHTGGWVILIATKQTP
jgi:hypothetical protein